MVSTVQAEMQPAPADALSWVGDYNGEPALYMRPHRGQLRLYDSTARFVIVVAGNQSGKTCSGPHWLHREMMSRGPGDYLAASANYDLMLLKMQPELQRYFGDGLGWDYQAGSKLWRNSADGSRLIMRSGVAEGGLESGTYKAAWVDEWGQPQVTVLAWEALLRRVGRHSGRVLLTTTPYVWGWLKTQVVDRAIGGDPDYDLITFRSIDNPTFPLKEYERARRSMPEWRFRMFYDGEFTLPAGLIYNVFDTSRDVVQPFSIPPAWPRHVGIDFGLVNTAILWLAEEPGADNYFVYRDYLGGGYTAAEHARACLEYNEPVLRWWGGSKSEDVQRRQWRLAGVPVTEPLIQDVEGGIDHCIGLIKQGRLKVFSSCTGTISELLTYSREVDDAGEPLAKIADKETFHRLDALRYGACAFPQSPVPREPAIEDDSSTFARRPRSSRENKKALRLDDYS